MKDSVSNIRLPIENTNRKRVCIDRGLSHVNEGPGWKG